jgi:terminase small subunit / prophage DNA-packing protein
MIVNQAQLSEVFDKSTVTLGEWQKEGMPYTPAETSGKANTYNTAECIEWYAQRQLAKAGVKNSKDRLDDVRAQREELALSRDLGRVVLVEDIEPAFAEYVQGMDQVLTGIPEKYTPLLEQVDNGEGRYRLLQQMMDEIREAAANYERCTQAPRATATQAEARDGADSGDVG